MAGALKRALTPLVRCIRGLVFGRLSEVGDMFDAASARLSEIEAKLDALSAESGARAAVVDRLESLSAQLDALRSARTLSPGGLIDYQVETARYYLESAIGDIAPGFKALYERCKEYTIASAEQLYAVHTAIDYLIRRKIAGDIVDCGAGLGGTAMMAALTLSGRDGGGRRLVLCDSFAELPAEADETVAVDRAGEIRARLEATGYPAAAIEIVAGFVERTVPHLPADAIALLRIDTDSYTATKAALESLCPHLAPGAVLLVNDAPSLFGPRQALAEFFAGDGKLPLFHRIDYCTRVAVWSG